MTGLFVSYILMCMQHHRSIFTSRRIVVGVGAICSVIIFFGSTLFFMYNAMGQRFSSTQVWDPAIRSYLETESFLVTSTYELPPPPTNISLTTARELMELHSLAAHRTEEQIATINAEIMTNLMVFNGVPYGELVDEATRPETYRLMKVVHEDLRRHLIRAKDAFDRVRPSFLDTELTTAITVPGHPAYPSGHATETYLYALIFGVLDPVHRDAYIADAYRIARNREIAGVHYPSDSAAGRALAAWYFDELEKSPWYQEQLERASVEWE